MKLFRQHIYECLIKIFDENNAQDNGTQTNIFHLSMIILNTDSLFIFSEPNCGRSPGG